MMRRLSGAFLAALIVALAATPLFSKPPDLPQDPKIVVAPQPAPEGTPNPQPDVPRNEGLFPLPDSVAPDDSWEMTKSLHELWTTSLFLDVDPLMSVWTADDATAAEPAKPQAAQPQSVCPYVREQSAAKPIRVIAKPKQFRSVMDNLKALEQAGELIQKARQLAGEGRYEEATECLDKAKTLCPGSSYDKMIKEVLFEIINKASLEGMNEKKTDSGEEQEPEGGGCCCGCMFQFGMCWMSQLADWCKEQETNADVQQASASACPKCEILHAKYVKKAGVAEQVQGLMKACYLAIGEERYEKAADLARQAYALDPERVESDPLIYKMHLLVEQGVRTSTKCKKCGCPVKTKSE